MQDSLFYLAIALTGLLAVALLSSAALRGWRDYLSLKRAELNVTGPINGSDFAGSATSRIEIADLKERIKKLEAIAAGVDL